MCTVVQRASHSTPLMSRTQAPCLAPVSLLRLLVCLPACLPKGSPNLQGLVPPKCTCRVKELHPLSLAILKGASYAPQQPSRVPFPFSTSPHHRSGLFPGPHSLITECPLHPPLECLPHLHAHRGKHLSLHPHAELLRAH